MAGSLVDIQRDGAVARVTLNRPEVRNAFNNDVIAELRAWADRTAVDSSVRIVVLSGAGTAFSAGADLEWMARGVDLGYEAILAEAQALHQMLDAIDRLPQAVIGRVQGAAIAGGVGLVAVCDAVVAVDHAMFGFSEVKLGIVPAIVSPFVIAKIGRSAARELFVTGARFAAARACELGLVHRVVAHEHLEEAVQQYVTDLRSAEPGAVRAAKALVREVAGRDPSTAFEITGSVIADRRLSAEGQAGVRAFLQKRPPPWCEDPAASR